MKIERKELCLGKPYFTVLIQPGELVVDSGKVYPFSTWLGTISVDGSRINLWSPVGYKPRGYPEAAKAMLERAQQAVKDAHARGVEIQTLEL